MTTPTLDDLLATPEPFSQWLAGFANDAEMAITCNAARCPIAHFLLDKTGHLYRVGFAGVLDWEGNYIQRMTGWAADFITTIDNEAGHNARRVTAAQCRVILASVIGSQS